LHCSRLPLQVDWGDLASVLLDGSQVQTAQGHTNSSTLVFLGAMILLFVVM